jgi:hypothetical protein
VGGPEQGGGGDGEEAHTNTTVPGLYLREKITKKLRERPASLTHCKEISIYVVPEKELRGLSPDFHIHNHVSVSDPYIPTFGTPIFLQQNKQPIRGIYKSLTET